MDRKRKYRILLIGIVGILCFAAVLLYTCQNRMKKELTEKLEAWLQGREGTFVIEQEVVSYAQDWKIECWQKNTWEQAAEADGWEDCLYSASARGMDKQRFLIPKDVEFFPDKIYRLVKKLYFLEEEEKDWMAGEIQFL